MTKPLHFFPGSSWAYAEMVVVKEKTEQDGLTAAAKKWHGSDHAPGEKADLYNQQCFDTEDPLDESFKEAAVAVLEPLMEHRKKVEV